MRADDRRRLRRRYGGEGGGKVIEGRLRSACRAAGSVETSRARITSYRAHPFTSSQRAGARRRLPEDGAGTSSIASAATADRRHRDLQPVRIAGRMRPNSHTGASGCPAAVMATGTQSAGGGSTLIRSEACRSRCVKCWRPASISATRPATGIRRWRDYIFGQRNKIHIVNLEKTLAMYKDAMKYVRQLAANRGTILFVGTKRQAREIVAEEAQRAGMPFVDHRWLGGMLTNFKTVKGSIKRLKDLEAMKQDGTFERMSQARGAVAAARDGQAREEPRRHQGHERAARRDLRHRRRLPQDRRDRSEEARHSDRRAWSTPTTIPDGIAYVIPGNDDSSRAIRLYARGVADAVLEGKSTVDPGDRRRPATSSSKSPTKRGLTERRTKAGRRRLRRRSPREQARRCRARSVAFNDDRWSNRTWRKFPRAR